eukprot:1155438-Pelagomonas_calceolata.AAC.2
MAWTGCISKIHILDWSSICVHRRWFNNSIQLFNNNSPPRGTTMKLPVSGVRNAGHACDAKALH